MAVSPDAKVALALGYLLQIQAKADEAVAKKGDKKRCYINAEFVKDMVDKAVPAINDWVMAP